MRRLLTVFVFVLINWIHCTPLTAGSGATARIARFQGDAKGAFSYTFDDGFDHQVENALRVIDPLGIRGTFFVMPLSMEKDPDKFVTWERLREIHANGHEIGTHASIHPKLHEVDPDVAESIINGGWTLIRDEVGVAPVSFAYPGGSRRVPEVQSIVEQHHFFIRGKAVGYGSTEFRNWTPEKARQQVNEAIEQGEWLIAFVHAIIDGYSPFKSIEEFEAHSRWLSEQGDALWIAPMGIVGRYVQERDAASLKILHSTDQSLEFELICDLRPETVFNHPLTVVVDIPVDTMKTTAETSCGEAVPITRQDDGKILLEVLPGSGPVTVAWE